MAPIKFEKHIKDTLEKRSIAPSSKSWETLSKRLEDHQSKKSSKSIWYIGIAASIIGILFLINGFFVDPSMPAENMPIIVDSDQAEPMEAVELKTEGSQNNVPNQEVVEIEKSESIEPSQSTVPLKQAVVSKSSVKLPSKLESKAVIAENQDVNQSFSEQDKTISKTKSFGKSDAAAMNHVAINTQEDIIENTGIDSEIDALLNEAQLQMDSNKIKRSVNANSLLQDVEADLEQSFRDKVFESIKTNFKKVRTAVVDRNN